MSRTGRPDYDVNFPPLATAGPGEPTFVIRAQDAASGPALRAYAAIAEELGADPELVASARAHAQRMDEWRPKKLPDLPKTKSLG